MLHHTIYSYIAGVVLRQDVHCIDFLSCDNSYHVYLCHDVGPWYNSRIMHCMLLCNFIMLGSGGPIPTWQAIKKFWTSTPAYLSMSMRLKLDRNGSMLGFKLRLPRLKQLTKGTLCESNRIFT